jgi:hypothetical protein
VKKIKLLVGFLVAIVMLGAISGPAFSAQHKLDGVWLNTKLKAQLYLVSPSTGAYTKQKGSGNDYMHFVWVDAEDPEEDYYAIEFWTLTDDGDYVHVEPYMGPFRAYPNLPGENFIPDFSMYVPLSSTEWVALKQTVRIDYTEKDGVITKVKFTGRGQITGGNYKDQRCFGWFDLKGTSVDPSKLPFNPNP